jgi:hypothetical protein
MEAAVLEFQSLYQFMKWDWRRANLNKLVARGEDFLLTVGNFSIFGVIIYISLSIYHLPSIILIMSTIKFYILCLQINQNTHLGGGFMLIP